MELSKEQLDALAPYESFMRTAVKSNWSRYPGRDALQEMHRILEEVTGRKRPLNVNCQSCVLNLLRDCGTIYFKAKSAREVGLSETDAAPVAKVAVNKKGIGAKLKKRK